MPFSTHKTDHLVLWLLLVSTEACKAVHAALVVESRPSLERRTDASTSDTATHWRSSVATAPRGALHRAVVKSLVSWTNTLETTALEHRGRSRRSGSGCRDMDRWSTQRRRRRRRRSSSSRRWENGRMFARATLTVHAACVEARHGSFAASHTRTRFHLFHLLPQRHFSAKKKEKEEIKLRTTKIFFWFLFEMQVSPSSDQAPVDEPSHGSSNSLSFLCGCVCFFFKKKTFFP